MQYINNIYIEFVLEDQIFVCDNDSLTTSTMIPVFKNYAYII